MRIYLGTRCCTYDYDSPPVRLFLARTYYPIILLALVKNNITALHTFKCRSLMLLVVSWWDPTIRISRNCQMKLHIPEGVRVGIHPSEA